MVRNFVPEYLESLGLKMKRQQYDIFISHASEDKEAIAEPLAEFLLRFGVRVWYDEYTLEIGDSLSESIDLGLVSCRFGVVVLSESFFAKPWARRELAGLVAKEVAKKKVILPILHKVGVDAVRKVSPTMADRYALSTDRESVEVIGFKILRVVRPDIFDNIQRWVLWDEKIRQAKPVLANLRDLKPSSRRHENLPNTLLVRARLVHQIVGNVVGQTLDEMVDLFCRDLHPHREIEVWERIAAAYQEVKGKFSLSSEEEYTVLRTLLGFSMGHPDCFEENTSGDSELYTETLKGWKKLIPKPPTG